MAEQRRLSARSASVGISASRQREAEYLKLEAEEAMFDAFRQAVGDDLWARAKNGGADCKIVQTPVGRYLSRYTKYEPRLRIERHYTGVGDHQSYRARDYKISDDFKNPIEYLKEIAHAHAVSVQSMDEDEKYIADMGLKAAYGVMFSVEHGKAGSRRATKAFWGSCQSIR